MAGLGGAQRNPTHSTQSKVRCTQASARLNPRILRERMNILRFERHPHIQARAFPKFKALRRETQPPNKEPPKTGIKAQNRSGCRVRFVSIERSHPCGSLRPATTIIGDKVLPQDRRLRQIRAAAIRCKPRLSGPCPKHSSVKGRISKKGDRHAIHQTRRSPAVLEPAQRP